MTDSQMSSATETQNSSNLFSIFGIVLGGLALIVVPLLLGTVGIILASIGKKKKESLSTLALVISIVGTVVGVILGAAIGAAVFS
jgi:membrane protein DedA with SNARE-associated domain